MTRLPGGLEDLTATPAATDFIEFIKASDGTLRKATVNSIASAAQVMSLTTGITAFATGGQTSATALTTEYNLVTVCATAGDSVKLIAAAAGEFQIIKNIGAAVLAVFPASGDAINAMAVNLSIDIPVGGEVTFTAIDATTWHTSTTLDLPAPSTQKGNLVIKAADSAGNTQTLITNASQAAARTYTIPDAGASTTFVMGAGTQTVAGATTFTLAVPISAVTNQLVLGTTNTTTLSASAPAASRVITLADPLGNDSVAYLAAAQTLTNKTINGAIFAGDNAVASATLSRTSSVTLTNVTGMVVTVVPGTYRFRVDAPCVSTANTGIRVGFKLTTAVITSGAISGKGFSAAASEIAAYSTTVTDQALWYDTAAGVDLKIELDGTLVIGTGGTMQFQMGQHTSHGDTTSIYAGAYMTFTRIA